jgi:hypothetical protein
LTYCQDLGHLLHVGLHHVLVADLGADELVHHPGGDHAGHLGGRGEAAGPGLHALQVLAGLLELEDVQALVLLLLLEVLLLLEHPGRHVHAEGGALVLDGLRRVDLGLDLDLALRLLGLGAARAGDENEGDRGDHRDDDPELFHRSSPWLEIESEATPRFSCRY